MTHTNATGDGMYDTPCPYCGALPYEPHPAQEDGPLVAMLCMDDHLYVYDRETDTAQLWCDPPMFCPECGSDEIVSVWDESDVTDTPDYLGCTACDADMLRLKDQ